MGRSCQLLTRVYVRDGDSRPSRAWDDVLDDTMIVYQGMSYCFESSNENGRGGCTGADYQVGVGGPLHTHHQDMLEGWGGSECLIQGLNYLDATRAVSATNGLVVMNNSLWEGGPR